MVSPQFHISYDDLLETVRPKYGNPPTYSNWQAFTGLRNHEHPVRDPKDAAPQIYERPKTIITWDAPNLPTVDREEVFPVENLPASEE